MNRVKPFTLWKHKRSGMVIMALKTSKQCGLKCDACNNRSWTGIVIKTGRGVDGGENVFEVKDDWCIADSVVFEGVIDGCLEQDEQGNTE